MLDFPPPVAAGAIYDNWTFDGTKWTGGAAGAPSGGGDSGTLPISRNITAAATAGSNVIPTNCNFQLYSQTGSITTYMTTMPTAPVDDQDMIIASRGMISAWTLTPNGGQAIDAAPTSLPAGTAVWFRWVAPLSTWVRLL